MRSIGSCQHTKADNTLYITKNLAFASIFSSLWKNTSTSKAILTPHHYPVHLEDKQSYQHNTSLPPPNTLKELLASMKAKQAASNKTLYNKNLHPDIEAELEDFSSSFLNSAAFKVMAILGISMQLICFFGFAYLSVKMFELKTIVTGLAMSQGIPLTRADPITSAQSCQTPWFSYTVTIITMLGIIMYSYRLWKKLALCKGFKYSNHCKLYLFLSQGPYYVPIKLINTAAPIHLVHVSANPEQIVLTNRENLLWDVLTIDWKGITFTSNLQGIMVPSTLAIPFWTKFRLRKLMAHPNYTPSIMAKQANTWYNISPDAATAAPNVAMA